MQINGAVLLSVENPEKRGGGGGGDNGSLQFAEELPLVEQGATFPPRTMIYILFLRSRLDI